MLAKLALAASLMIALVVAAPVGGSSASVVGYVGCSTSTQAVHGYALQGGTRLWRPPAVFNGKGELGVYPGGTPAVWTMARSNPTLPHWAQMEGMARVRPKVTAVWFQICMGKADVGTLEHARVVAAMIHQRFPDTTLYVSPMTDYVNPPERVGASLSVAIADQLVAEGIAVHGPTMPKLQPRELLADGVHENLLGMRRSGLALIRFFGTGMAGLS